MGSMYLYRDEDGELKLYKWDGKQMYVAEIEWEVSMYKNSEELLEDRQYNDINVYHLKGSLTPTGDYEEVDLP